MSLTPPLQRCRRAFLTAMTLLGIASFWPAASLANGDFIDTPPPRTGAFAAEFVEERSHVSVINFSGNYDADLADGRLNSEARAVVAREFYRTHEDEYDFLVVFSAFEFDSGDALAFHIGVKNEVEGIGVPVFDYSGEFGSDGKLQGYIDMAALSRYQLDPLNPRFELVMRTLSHEILHQWAARVHFQNPDGSLNDGLIGKDGSHWSYLLDSNASVEYGARWRDNGDGSFTATAVRQFYSPLDLYLMGLYSADEVPPFVLIENPAIDKTQIARENDKIEGEPRLVTIEDIIAAEGERVPSADAAQKEFRIGFILLKGASQQIPNHYFRALADIRQAYGQRFAIATGGRGLAHVYPQAVYAYGVGAPTEVNGGEVISGPSIDDGIAWLRDRQETEGYWEDKETTRLRDTAYSLATLLRFDDSFSGAPTAIDWLKAQQPANTDFLARQLASLADHPAAAVQLSRLLTLQNGDGGWGLAEGYASDPLDTALAILALRQLGSSSSVINRAMQYLLLVQNADGGWGNVPGSASRSGITATVLQAMRASVSATAAIEDAFDLLRLRQNGDGGFGDSPSTIYDSALVLQAFMDFDRLEQIEAEAAALYLFNQQTTDGSWGGSTYATALAITALKRFNFANWQLAPQLTIEPADPRDGDRVRLVVTITNDSNLFTPETTLAIFNGNPMDGGQPIGGFVSIPVLAPGATVTLTQYWDSFDQAGVHELYAFADPDGLFTELSESDNQGSVTVTVQPAAQGIDLSIIETDIAVMPVRPNALPSTIGFVANLRNSGNTDASQVRVVLIRESPDGASVVDETQVNVPNRASIVVNFSDVLTAPGETRYSLVIDPENDIAEANESNNSANISVGTEASIDLEVTAADIAADVTPAYFGEAVNFEVSIRNRGTRDTPTTQVRYLVSNGVESRQLATNNLQLAAAQTIQQTINWVVDLSGALQFTAEVDFDALVTELDESNNQASIGLEVENRIGANLVVSYRDLGFSPQVANEGGMVNLAAAILNNGNVGAGAFDVAFYLGDPAAGLQIGARQQVGSLAPGGTAFVSLDWDSIPSAGDKLIYVVADVDDSVAESSADDNSAFNILRVLSLPDLAVSSSDIAMTPQFPNAGAAVTVAATIANLGEQSAGDVLVRLYYGEPGSAGQLVGEQSIASLQANASAALDFEFTLGPETSARSLIVEVDPNGAVLERNRDNNTARKEVSVQRGDIYASNLYLSPNADGIQDTTEVVFILEEPASVMLQVLDARDRVLREYRDDLVDITQGSVIWDGLDGKGRLVVDGDYRLRLSKTNAEYLAEVLVHVDTNRSSLLLAVNSDYQLYRNLSCELDNVYAINVLDSEQKLVIEAGEADIFSLNADGSEARTLVSEAWFDGTYPYYTQATGDGSLIAFSRYDPAGDVDYLSPVWAVDETGENRREVHPQVEDGWVLSDDGRTIYAAAGYYEIVAIDVATGVEVYHSDDEYYEIDAFSLKPQPGGDMLLFIDEYYEDSGPSVVLINGQDPSVIPVPLAYNWRNDEDISYEWSPDGSRIAVTSAADGAVFLFDSAGNELVRIDSPAGPRSGPIDSLAWSSAGAEVAFGLRVDANVDEALGNTRGIYVFELDNNRLSKVASLAETEREDELSSYHVSTWDGSDWVVRGELHYRRFFREQQLDLSAYLPDIDGAYKVRIRQVGKEAAHVESVSLLSGKRRSIPSSAVKLEPSLVNSLAGMVSKTPRGEDALTSVSHNDYEVLDLFESEMQVEWREVAKSGQVILALNAREEALSKLNALPFTYAGNDESGFAHVLGSGAAIQVDGHLDANDGFSKPLFQHFSRPGTGHPAATVNGYVGSDSDFLYGALDFTVDNTMDGDLDWASMRVMTEQGWREFRVTVQDERYGLVNFTRTPAVAFTHKYYEFRIPLAELGKAPGDSVQVSFQGYGTAAIVIEESSTLPADGRLLWPAGDRALLYDAYGEGKWVIDLNRDNQVKEVFTDWPGSSSDIIDPFFLDSGRKLMFQSDRATNDPASICYDRGTDLWSYESLLNLVVDLRAARSNSSGGIILSGTVSDLNFERYTLEYASQSAADTWLPIFAAAATQIVDSRFTVWAPPAVDRYLLRLTAFDRAGNQRSVVRRASWGLTSAITDLSVTPEYISPNGDGVQDVASLQYRVLEPVHLDISILNSQGDVVRSFTRDHALIGTDHSLTWDGRDQLGRPVPDGRYRVTVLGFEFFVNVDASAPQIVNFNVINARQETGAGEDRSVVSAPALDWAIVEANQYQLEIETGDGEVPDQWRPFAQPLARDNDPQTIDIDESSSSLTTGQFVDRAFRMRVTDVAGNVSTLTLAPGEQQLILTGLIVEEFDDLEARGFQVEETIAAPLAQAFIEYRDLGDSQSWREIAIDAAELANGRFGFEWVPPEAGARKSFELRIKAVDNTAREFYSNVKRLQFANVVEEVLRFGSNNFYEDVAQSQRLNGLDASGLLVLGAPLDASRQIVLESVRLELSSSTDPNYLVPVTLLDLEEDIALMPGADWEAPYLAPNLTGCELYKSVAHVNLRLVDNSGETPLTRRFILQLSSQGDSATEDEVQMPCLSIKAEVSYPPVQSCSVQTEAAVELSLVPESGNEFGLKLLTLYTRDAAGEKDVFYNVNKPNSGQTYRYRVNGGNHSEGVLRYYAELTNDANDVWVEELPVLIDRTQPLAAITYPVPGQLVCAVPRLRRNGEYENVVNIDVDVDDPIGDRSQDDPLNPFKDKLSIQMQASRLDSPALQDLLLGQNDEQRSRKYEVEHAVQGRLTELLDANGDYQVLLQATDLASNQQCLVSNFTIDGKVEHEELSTDYRLFSPNDDAELDSLDVRVAVDEAVSLDVSVFAAQKKNNRFVISGDEIRRIANQQQILPGSELIAWDGREAGGQVAEDGDYFLLFDFRDACGNRSQRELLVTLDNTVPEANIDYPQTGDPLTSILELQLSLDDKHLKQYQLELGQGSDPQTWVELAAGSRALIGEVVATWNTLSRVGPYTLRLSVSDHAGNVSEQRAALVLLERSSLFSYFEVLPLLISPNDDNRRETASIRVGLEADALISLDILDENDALVRSLEVDRAFAAGAANLAWDGRNDSGVTVADGSYQVALKVALASNPLVRESVSLTLLVDASAPQVEITSPQGFANGADNVVGSISDTHLFDYEVFLTSTPQSPEWINLVSGNRNQSQQPLIGLGDLQEGDYALRVRASDTGETVSERVLEFSIDNTPPEVAILTPEPDAFVGTNTETAALAIDVSDENLQSYQLNIGSGDAPDSWTELISGTELPIANPVATLNVDAFTDGVYTLQLLAVDAAANQAAVSSQIRVDNTAPLATMRAPIENDYVTAPMEILGTATDLNLLSYRLDVAPGSQADASQWSPIGSGDTEISDASLLNWRSLPPDGAYVLRLSVEDRAANITTAAIVITVDTLPPTAPMGLDGSIEDTTTAHLVWQPGVETDIAGYRVYRDGIEVTTAAIDATEFLDAGLGDGRFRYSLRAEDHAGWLSEESSEIELVVDTTPPITRIFSPVDGSVTSGIIDLRGTANSADDFREYRVYLRQGQNSVWQLLKQSPVPIIADVLHQLDTASFAEGAAFGLKLEAEDINGNVGTAEVSLSVDNQPPLAPTGLVAIDNDNDVGLTWNPNAEADLLGYLLFRGDRIANADGIVIGDLTPYALPTTNFNDLDVADGRYAYTVAAIDQAGNISDRSLASEVFIDTRAPSASIDKPANDARFGTAQYVTAISDATDIARMQFQYKPAAAVGWVDLGTADESEPYAASLDPLALNLAQGAYQLRAIATDLGGRIDPAPAAILVYYTDVTRPVAVTGLVAQATGADVLLTWDASAESDLAGYLVDRIDQEDVVTRLNTSLLSETTLVDSVDADGIYRYRVMAQDSNANIGDASNTATTRVHTPRLQQPYTPVATPGPIELSGRGLAASVVSGTLENSNGEQDLEPVASDGTGLFRLSDLGLELGENLFTVQVTDDFGNVSRDASVSVTYGLPPATPTGVTADVAGYDVNLSWEDNTEPNLAGYRVYRDDEALLSDYPALIVAAEASDNNSRASRAIDGSRYSYWSLSSSSQLSSDPALVTFTLDQAELVTRLEVEWYFASYRALDYDVEARFGDAWVTLERVRNANDSVQSLTLATPYFSDQLRLRLLRAYRLESDVFNPVRLSEVRVHAAELLTLAAYQDTTLDGEFDYAVSAVNRYGFESEGSDILSVEVGDVTAPDEVQLSATVLAADVQLSWLASASSDVSRYELFRDGSLLAEFGMRDLSYVDTNLGNGSYAYVVYALDSLDQRSLASNQVEVSVAVAPLEAPEFVSLTAPPEGASLDLLWLALADAEPRRYQVFRAQQTGGPYSVVAEVTATQYRDLDLDNGTTYFYRIAALDEAGNPGQQSIELSAMPQDQIEPTVVLLSPGAGEAYVSTIPRAAIIGQSEPAALIRLLHDGIPAQETTASKLASATAYPVESSSMAGSLSPDGGTLLQVLDGNNLFTNLADGTTRNFFTSVNHNHFRWSGNGQAVVYARPVFGAGQYRDTVYERTVEGRVNRLTNPYSGDGLDYPIASSDASRFAAIGQPAGEAYGLWLYSRTDQEWTLLKAGGAVLGASLIWSPDDRYLAYLTLDDSGLYKRLELIDLGNAAITVIGDDTDRLGRLSWSVDGASLFYARVENAATNLWQYSTQSGLAEALTTGDANNFTDPQAFIGSRQLLAVANGIELVLIDIERDVVTPLYPTAGIVPGSLHKTTTGVFGFVDGSRAELIRYTPAGHFVLDEVPLRLGENRFTATASDGTGLTRDSQNALTISYDVGDKPDLVLHANAIRTVPSVLQAGGAATVEVEVINQGGAAVSGALLSLVVTDAQGFSEVLLGNALLDYLAPGQRTSVSAGWTPALAGAYRLYALVDPDRQIDEGYEDNNSVSRSTLVVAVGGPLLNLSTDKHFYTADERVVASVDLYNAGNAYSGYLEVIIEDAAGFSVDRIVAQQPVELEFGGSDSLQFDWNTAAIFAGGYQVHAYLYAQDHQLVAEQIASFDIGETRGFSSQVFTDQQSYAGNRDVLVSASLDYAAGNSLFDGATARIQIVDANAIIVTQREFEPGSMLPGDTQRFNLRWNTALSSPGDYAVQFDVIRDQQLLTQAISYFSLQGGMASVEGNLSLPNDAPAVGEQQSVDFQITNVNNLALEQLPIRVRLIDPAAQTVLADQQWTINIGAGASVSMATQFDTASLQLRSYNLLLEASIEGATGAYWTNLASADFAPRDRSAPLLEVLRPLSNDYLRGDADLRVSATDDLSFVDRVEVRVDAGAWRVMSVTDAARGEYKLALPGLPEGQHSLQARATDAWDNSAQSEVVAFIVDNTAPVIDVSGVTDAGIYNSMVTPIVAIGETNPGSVYITRGGQPFVSGEAVVTDGSYVIEIYATDLAGNESQLLLEFDIDQIAPAIEVTGVVDGSTYNDAVTPSVRISDANLESQQITLNGQPYLSATPIVEEGDYQLLAVGIDTAGNRSEVEYLFRIDRSPPLIFIDGVIDQAYYNDDVSALIDIEDASAFDASITLNGEPYLPGDSIGTAGRYQLLVNASDISGNQASAEVEFVIDRNAPEITIGGVTDNGFYQVAVPQISVEDENLDGLGVTLDGVDFISQTPVTLEGNHLLVVTATDKAGNESAREVFFTVDFTVPEVSVDTPLHGETLFTRNTDVVGTTEPFATVSLQFGDTRVSTQSDADGEFEFNGVVLEQGFNTLLLDAVDRAANLGPVTEVSVQVVSGNVPGEYRAPGGVLIWSPLEQYGCDEGASDQSKKSGKSDKSRKSDKSSKSKKSRKSKKSKKSSKGSSCHRHQPGEMLAHEAETALGVIETAMADQQRDFLLVHSEADFIRALRSQRFGTLMLLDWHADYCDKYDSGCSPGGFSHEELEVSKDARNEIRAMVASGSGLIWVKTHTDSDKHWESLLGVEAKSSLKDIDNIEVADDSIVPSGTYSYLGRSVKLELKGAEAIAVAEPQGRPIITSHDYAQGRVVVLALNPAALADPFAAVALLDGIFAHVAPSTSELTVNGVTQLEWLVEDVAAGTTVELRVSLPPELSYLLALDADLNETSDEAVWLGELEQQENRYVSLVRLSPVAGLFSLDATLSEIEGEQSFVLSSSQLSLEINDGLLQASTQLRHSVEAIETSKQGKSSKHDKHAIEKILQLLDDAFAHDPQLATPGAIEQAIEALNEVAYELDRKTLNAESMTRQVGHVMRYYQSAWYRQVIEGGLSDGE